MVVVRVGEGGKNELLRAVNGYGKVTVVEYLTGMSLNYRLGLPELDSGRHPRNSVGMSCLGHDLVCRLIVDKLLESYLLHILGLLSHIDECAEVVLMCVSEEPACDNDVIGIVSKCYESVVEPLGRCDARVCIGLDDTAVDDEEASVSELVNVSHSSGPTCSTNTDNGERRIGNVFVLVVKSKSGKIELISVVNHYSYLPVSVEVHNVDYLLLGKNGCVVVLADSVLGVKNKSVEIKLLKIILVLREGGVLCYMHKGLAAKTDVALVKGSSVILGKIYVCRKVANIISENISIGELDVPGSIYNELTGVALSVCGKELSYLFDQSLSALLGCIGKNVLAVYELSSSLARLELGIYLSGLSKCCVTKKDSRLICVFLFKVGSNLGGSAYRVSDSRSERGVGVLGELVSVFGSDNACKESTLVKKNELIGRCFGGIRTGGVGSIVAGLVGSVGCGSVRGITVA